MDPKRALIGPLHGISVLEGVHTVWTQLGCFSESFSHVVSGKLTRAIQQTTTTMVPTVGWKGRLTSLQSYIKQNVVCYRFSCRAPPYLPSFLVQGTGGETGNTAVALSSSRVMCLLLPSWIWVHLDGGAHPPLLPPRSWKQIPYLLGCLSQSRHSYLFPLAVHNKWWTWNPHSI